MFINKNFSLMWFYNFTSILNGRFRELVIPLIVLGFTQSPFITALVALSQQVGAIFFSIPIGTWLEAKNKVLCASVSNFFYGICLFLLAYIFSFDVLNSLLSAVILFIMGLLALISRTAFAAMIPEMSGRENLLRAHTSLEGADAICTIIGPILGGILLSQIGASPTLVLCGGLSISGMMILSLIKRVNNVQPTHEKRRVNLHTFTRESVVGLTILLANPTQRMVSFSHCVLSFATVFIPLTVIFHADTLLQFSAGEIGIILSCAGIGNLIGVMIMNWFRTMNWLTLLCSLLATSSLGVLLICVSENIYILSTGMIFFDGALSMAFVAQISVHQGITPDEYITRVRSATFVTGGLFAMMGTFLAGLIPELLSSYVSLFIGFLSLLLPAIFLIRWHKYSSRFGDIKPISIKT
ncbi:MFS transporter [Bacillus gibsonii]|nr:MFS transporter [Alkalicoccobacillus gibsonii]